MNEIKIKSIYKGDILKIKNNHEINEKKFFKIYYYSKGKRHNDINFFSKNKENSNFNKVSKMKYLKSDNDEIIIFGNYFTKINRKKCKIFIKNKQYNLTNKIKIYNTKNIIQIKLKFLDDPINLSALFNRCSSLLLLIVIIN